MIFFIAIDKEDEVTMFFNHEYCRSAQERNKIVVKYEAACNKFLEIEKMKTRKNTIVNVDRTQHGNLLFDFPRPS